MEQLTVLFSFCLLTCILISKFRCCRAKWKCRFHFLLVAILFSCPLNPFRPGFCPFVYPLDCSDAALLLPPLLYHPQGASSFFHAALAQDALQKFPKSGVPGLSSSLRNALASWVSWISLYFQCNSFSLRFWRMKFSLETGECLLHLSM